jgi:hypothetical protein
MTRTGTRARARTRTITIRRTRPRKLISQKQKQEAAVFLKEFARRRNLSLSIFPESFINWINE